MCTTSCLFRWVLGHPRSEFRDGREVIVDPALQSLVEAGVAEGALADGRRLETSREAVSIDFCDYGERVHALIFWQMPIEVKRHLPNINLSVCEAPL